MVVLIVSIVDVTGATPGVLVKGGRSNGFVDNCEDVGCHFAFMLAQLGSSLDYKILGYYWYCILCHDGDVIAAPSSLCRRENC